MPSKAAVNVKNALESALAGTGVSAFKMGMDPSAEDINFNTWNLGNGKMKDKRDRLE